MHDQDAILSKQIEQLDKRLQALDPLIHIAPKLVEIADAYESVMFGKKFLIGLATVVGALAVIGGGVIWLVGYIRHG